jgi:hypothetical protein
MGLDTKTYWLTDLQSQCNFDFDFDFDLTTVVVEKWRVEFRDASLPGYELGGEDLNWVESWELEVAEQGQERK